MQTTQSSVCASFHPFCSEYFWEFSGNDLCSVLCSTLTIAMGGTFYIMLLLAGKANYIRKGQAGNRFLCQTEIWMPVIRWITPCKIHSVSTVWEVYMRWERRETKFSPSSTSKRGKNLKCLQVIKLLEACKISLWKVHYSLRYTPACSAMT